MYEVNTSFDVYLICVWYRMRKRSIPQLRITINPYCWMVRVRRGYMPRLRVSISSYVGYLMWWFFWYMHMWSRVYEVNRIYVINIHVCILPIMWFQYRMFCFSGEGSWWPSSHFCENGVVTILFSTIFFFLLTSPLVTSISLCHDTFMASMMLRT